MSDFAKQLPLLMVLVVAYSGAFIAFGILMWRKRRAHAARRSPLTADLLRAAGQGIQDELEDMLGWLFLLVIAPLIMYSIHLTQSYVIGAKESTFRTGLSVLAGLCFVSYGTFKLLRLAHRKEKLSIGRDAEVMVAQELNQLMREGATVYHDVPAEGFNIDHVVLCSAGVFALETKGRSKPKTGNGKMDALVEFDGKALKFPRWTETKPLAQAERQAQWLQKWLSSAVGEALPVTPVLVLPGWFVERPGKSRVLVFNGKNPNFLLRMKNSEPLSPQTIQRVAHQIEQRCRTVKRALGPIA